MFYMLVALVLGAIFYTIGIVIEFKNQEMERLPVIEDLERKIETLQADIVSEMPLLEDVKVRVAALRGVREDLMQELEACRGDLEAEKAQHKQLMLEVHKRQFQGTLAQGRRLVLK